MLQIILGIIGIVYLVRRPRYAQARAEGFPKVDPFVFEQWRGLEIKSIDIFLWATWGTFFLSLAWGFGLGLVVAAIAPSSDAGEMLGRLMTPLIGLMVLLFFGGLVWSAIVGSQAAKLRKQHGINVLNPARPAA